MSYLTKQRVRDGVLERQCKLCKEWWHLEEFVKHKRCAGGRRPVCKACRQEQVRAYRNANHEHYLAMERAGKKRRYYANIERARRIGRISRERYGQKSRAKGLPLHNERDRFGRWVAAGRERQAG